MQEKTLFLPEAQNDFLFAVIGEWWVLPVALGVLMYGIWLLWRIFRKKKR